MLLIGLVGLPGSGKGECARVATEAGFSVVSMGDLVRAHTNELGLESTDENIGGTAHAERERFGYDIWAKRTVQKIKMLEKSEVKPIDLLVIDGIRGDAEVQVFRSQFGQKFITIAVLMPDEKRFQLLQNRKRSDAPTTFEEFKTREARELKWGIELAIEQADYMIQNTGTIQELEDDFKELLSIIQKQRDKSS